MPVINFLKTSYQSLINAGNFLQSPLLLVVRIFWGALFYFAGMGKLSNIDSTISFFQSLGIPFPEFNTYLVAWVETVGGLCLMAGFASRLVAIPLIITMVVAFLTVHSDALHGFMSNPSGVFKESPFTYLFATLLIFIFGPGMLSVDALIERLFGNSKK